MTNRLAGVTNLHAARPVTQSSNARTAVQQSGAFRLKSLPKSKAPTLNRRQTRLILPDLRSHRPAGKPQSHLPFHLLGRRQAQTRLSPVNCKSSATRARAAPRTLKTLANSKPRAQVEGFEMGLRDSTRKLLRRFGARDKRQQEEVEQLQPVALAGASKRSTNRSELCSSFATTAVTREELEGRRKAVSEGSANWEQCGMCTRSFVAGTSRYAGFCSLDCKSAALYSQSARVYRGRYRAEKQ